MIDFSKLPIRKKTYGGANGNKLSVVIDSELYMIKLPSHAPHNKKMSYANSCVSEYLGSHIFDMAGIDSQDTMLGTYVYKGIERIAVACKDFEKNGFILKDFASVKNQIVDSESNGYGTELKDILETIEKQNLMDPLALLNHFWNIFAVDALIGNWDRHNGNWGFLYNQDTDEVHLAPVFDCASCLFPQIDEEEIASALRDQRKLDARIYNVPTSAIFLNGKRINYYQFIQSHSVPECDAAIARVRERIDLSKINELIENVACVSDTHKEFLKTILKLRYDKLLYVK